MFLGRKGERKGIVNVNPPNSSSDDELNSLSIKLKAKWKSEESMNLKTSLGIGKRCLYICIEFILKLKTFTEIISLAVH